MKVVAFDPLLSPERATDLGVEKVELDALFQRAHFITLHTPAYRQDTQDHQRRYYSHDARRCARQSIVREETNRREALFDALQAGKVAGAAIDVCEVEPATDDILFTSDNVICTPHLGASTREAQENIAIQIAEQISGFPTQRRPHQCAQLSFHRGRAKTETDAFPQACRSSLALSVPRNQQVPALEAARS